MPNGRMMASAFLPMKQVGAAAGSVNLRRCHLSPAAGSSLCSRLELPATYSAPPASPLPLPAVFVPVSQGPLQSEWSYVRQAVKYSSWMEAQASTQCSSSPLLPPLLPALPSALPPALPPALPSSFPLLQADAPCSSITGATTAAATIACLPAPAACPACRRVARLRATPMRLSPPPGPCAHSAWCLSTAGGQAASTSTSTCRWVGSIGGNGGLGRTAQDRTGLPGTSKCPQRSQLQHLTSPDPCRTSFLPCPASGCSTTPTRLGEPPSTHCCGSTLWC